MVWRPWSGWVRAQSGIAKAVAERNPVMAEEAMQRYIGRCSGSRSSKFPGPKPVAYNEAPLFWGSPPISGLPEIGN
jgi:hypothetical protein